MPGARLDTSAVRRLPARVRRRPGVFACGYLLVVVVHAGMSVLGLLGALFFEDVLAWWWLASFLIAVVVPRLVRVTSLQGTEEDGGPSFTPVPGHFVERHGLMLLIALGESVLAIGVGLGAGEDDRAEAALKSLPPERAQSAALASYGYAFWVMLFAIVLTAAGLHHALAHPSERLTWEYAGQLGVGVGGFWVGLGLFRLTLGLSSEGAARGPDLVEVVLLRERVVRLGWEISCTKRPLPRLSGETDSPHHTQNGPGP